MPQEHARSRAEEESDRAVRSDKEVPVDKRDNWTVAPPSPAVR